MVTGFLKDLSQCEFCHPRHEEEVSIAFFHRTRQGNGGSLTSRTHDRRNRRSQPWLFSASRYGTPTGRPSQCRWCYGISYWASSIIINYIPTVLTYWKNDNKKTKENRTETHQNAELWFLKKRRPCCLAFFREWKCTLYFFNLIVKLYVFGQFYTVAIFWWFSTDSVPYICFHILF